MVLDSTKSRHEGREGRQGAVQGTAEDIPKRLDAVASQTFEPALLDLVCGRELLAGAVADDQPCHGILGASILQVGIPTARATEQRGTGSSSCEYGGTVAISGLVLSVVRSGPIGYVSFTSPTTAARR